MSDDRERQIYQQFYAERVATIVSQLHRLADEFEREAKPYDTSSFDGMPRYANAAQRVLHHLTWGIANLNATYLVGDAVRVDGAEASLPQAEQGGAE